MITLGGGTPDGNTLLTELTTDDWCTPRGLAQALGMFDLDPCSNPRSHVQARVRYALPQNGLQLPWMGRVFLNPPYSDVLPWATRAVEHTPPGTVVALVKLDPTTKWWAKFMELRGVNWAPFKHRIKFERPDKPPFTANFPSALIWGGAAFLGEDPRDLGVDIWEPNDRYDHNGD